LDLFSDWLAGTVDAEEEVAMTDINTQANPHTSRHQALLTRALAANTGGRAWREWKAASANDVIQLATQAPRVEVLELSLEDDLNLIYRVHMPVPRWPAGDRLVLADCAIFHLHYQESWRWESPAGWAPLGLLQPQDVFHPNMRPALRGAICLGHLPPATSAKEIMLLGYYAVSLQDRVLDETDPNGVLNPAACEYYRQHPEYLPLTRAGFLDAVEGVS
jgi:hypothetical protein